MVKFFTTKFHLTIHGDKKAAFLMLMNFSGCGNEKPVQDGKIKVVATIFPVYDWTREIIGEDKNFDLMLLMDTKNQKILVLNSMQGKVAGETYLSVMEKNLSVLREALK